jgi:glycosyltransferase involved in cell wall biosynthesis
VTATKLEGVTCVIPARNESGHIDLVVSHTLSVAEISEIVIVEGNSKDDTWDKVCKLQKQAPEKIRVLQQTGSGKFNAVLEGAAIANYKHLIIWDADGTVPIECTRKILNHAILTGNATMGDRLRGSMERAAMQPANFVGNWVFAVLWSPILKSKPRDMLCGTKVFETEVFLQIPSILLERDPYGDFSLVTTARLMNKKVDSITVDYKARTYGETNIKRWSGGLKLLQVTLLSYWMIVENKTHE